MSFFFRSYYKPGPGVQKDEPRKKGAARFFELLFRDFWDLVKINLLFFVCILPTTAAFLIGFIGFYTEIAFILSLIFSIPVGGALVAYVYYITKMMRDDPSYVWYEFKRKFVENWKQAAPVGVLCTVFIYAQVLLWYYMVYINPTGDLVMFILSLLSILIFSMVTPYIFMHLAYIKLRTIGTLKNSFLLSFGYLPRSFMGAVTGGVIWILLVLYLPLSFLLLPLVALIFISLSMLLCLTWVWKPFDTQFKIEETLIGRKNEEEAEEAIE